jgi:hypothetical protein
MKLIFISACFGALPIFIPAESAVAFFQPVKMGRSAANGPSPRPGIQALCRSL